MWLAYHVTMFLAFGPWKFCSGSCFFSSFVTLNTWECCWLNKPNKFFESANTAILIMVLTSHLVKPRYGPCSCPRTCSRGSSKESCSGRVELICSSYMWCRLRMTNTLDSGNSPKVLQDRESRLVSAEKSAAVPHRPRVGTFATVSHTHTQL
jgi:hypothetical protein